MDLHFFDPIMSEGRREEAGERKKERQGRKRGKKERKEQNGDLTQGKERRDTQRCERADVCVFVRVLLKREECETQGENLTPRLVKACCLLCHTVGLPKRQRVAAHLASLAYVCNCA